MSTSLNPGSYLTGSAYNGGTARTFNVDATNANTANKVVARDASGNFSAGTITAALSGNASTATTLATARTINGVSFNGSANITVEPYISNDDTGDTNCPIIFSANSTAGYKRLYEDSALYLDNTNNRLVCTRILVGDYLYHNGDNSYLGFPGVDIINFATAGTERARITSGGNFGIGLTGPTEKLHVSGNILATGNVTAYSDKRVKTDIRKIEDPLNKLCSINGYTYKRTDTDDDKTHTGVLAQEVMEVLPEVVHGSEDTAYSVAYGNMVGLLIEAIKELKLEIDELKKSR